MFKVYKIDNRTYILDPYHENKLVLITVKMPIFFVEGLDTLVKKGRYTSRSEAIRTAVRDLLKKELWDAEHEQKQ